MSFSHYLLARFIFQISCLMFLALVAVFFLLIVFQNKVLFCTYTVLLAMGRKPFTYSVFKDQIFKRYYLLNIFLHIPLKHTFLNTMILSCYSIQRIILARRKLKSEIPIRCNPVQTFIKRNISLIAFSRPIL